MAMTVTVIVVMPVVMGAVWAILFFVVGLVYFYRGEKKYVN